MCLVQRERGLVDARRGPASLCEGLDECLHMAAQPLTVLRASLDAEAIRGLEDAQVRDRPLLCCAEVERLCEAVKAMRRLVELATTDRR